MEEPKQENRKICKCGRAYEDPSTEMCSLCWIELFPNYEDEEDLIELEQETIEEAAVKYLQKCRLSNNIHLSNPIHAERCKNDFIAGAKLQQERMYSEEDLRYAFECATDLNPSFESFSAWFEQFKKK
jgi:hypothetical protein